MWDLFDESPHLKQSSGCRTLNAACYGVLRGMLASQDWTVYLEPRSGARNFLLNHTMFCSFYFELLLLFFFLISSKVGLPAPLNYEHRNLLVTLHESFLLFLCIL